jgi:hypothetical protein
VSVAVQSLEAEELVLGAIMVAGAVGAEASAATIANVRESRLQASDFFRDTHATIYTALLSIDEQGSPSDVLALEKELRGRRQLAAVGGRVRLHELAALAPSTANAGHFASLVVEASELRAQDAAGLALRTAAANGGLARNPEVRDLVAGVLQGRRSAPGTEAAAPWQPEPWSRFRDETSEDHRWLVRGLLPAGMLAFVAAPPKKGKTWLGLGLALALAAGRPLFGDYPVPEPRSVLYVALEGSRVGIRARIGALARGLGLDPDGDDLDKLQLLYRPRPFDLAELATATWLQRAGEEFDAALVVVDVLRAAARIRENIAEDFAQVRDGLEPMLAGGRTVALLHHFGKLTETQKERSPGERMAGTGAMYGALDVGLLITKSESGARRMRVEVEARDFAAPDALGVVILGEGSGEHRGFTYTDKATLAIDPAAAEGRDLAAELERLFGELTADPEAELKTVWLTLGELASKEHGIGANKDDLLDVLEGSPDRFVQVEPQRVGRHKTAKPWGTVAMLANLEKAEKVDQTSEPPGPPSPSSEEQLPVEQVAPPKGESQPSHLLHDDSRAGAPVEPADPPGADVDIDEEEVERLAGLAREARHDDVGEDEGEAEGDGQA